MLYRLSLSMALLAGLWMGAPPVGAVPITFTGSGTGVDGASLAAQAIFDINGNTLSITLANTATQDHTTGGQDVPGNTLTGVFFTLAGAASLTPVSATIPAGSSLLQASTCSVDPPGPTPASNPCTPTTTNVGGEFIYATGSFPHGAGQGIASSGYISGSSGNFGGLNLDDPNAPNGINFGMISLDANFTPNGGLSKDPLIKNSVVFALTGVSDLTAADIADVSFQYGTALTEPNIPGECSSCDSVTTVATPEPGTMLLFGSGLTALMLAGWKKRQAKK